MTAARVAEIRDGLDERDWLILGHFARVRVLPGDQLVRLLDERPGPAHARAMRRRLARPSDEGVLARLPRQIGGRHKGSRAYLYILGPAGQRILTLGGQARTQRADKPPGHAFLAHTLAISELYVRLFRTSRLELISFDGEPTCWRTFSAPHGGTETLKPDAFVVAETDSEEITAFIEVDRGTESRKALHTKAERYLRYYHSGHEQNQGDGRDIGVFPMVLWVTPDQGRAWEIEAVVKRSNRFVPGMHVVSATKDALDALVEEGAGVDDDQPSHGGDHD